MGVNIYLVNKSVKAEGVQESSGEPLFYHSENVGWMWAE